MRFRSCMQVALVLLAVAALVSPLRADSIPIAGSTGGYFDDNPSKQTLEHLNFYGTTFSGVTAPDGSLALLNMGQLYYTSPGWLDIDLYTGHDFDLTVTFAVPVGVSDVIYIPADLHGLLTHLTGALSVNFDNTPQTVTYLNGEGSGSFEVWVNDLPEFAPGSSGGVITGGITDATFVAAVPEPGSWLMLGMGALALLGLRRFRR